MRYFEELDLETLASIFYKAPEEVDFESEEIQSLAVGAMLYTPATRLHIAEDLLSRKIPSLKSNTLCLEDAISEEDVGAAVSNLRHQFETLEASRDNRPLNTNLFIRIRNEEQLEALEPLISMYSKYIRGINIPKLVPATVDRYMNSINRINSEGMYKVKALPIIEATDFVNPATRVSALCELKSKLDSHRDSVMMVRVGATDFCGIYGVRRQPTSTIYDVLFVQSAFADILGLFAFENQYTVSGPVWEYFSQTKRLFKPLLRYSIFKDKEYNDGFRAYMIDSGLESLMREVFLDIETGFLGKTVIHPSHIVPVQSMLAVSREEYEDAHDIIAAEGGAIRSTYRNKMNEINPHRLWATKILSRARVYGVYHEDSCALDVIHAYWEMDKLSTQRSK